jgi:hypothetical protein
METTPPPTYTSGNYWGGTVLPYWVLMLFTAFPLTGFLGLDHLLFRSPSTAIFKLITNFFTFGFWYMYDIVQVFTDKQFIKNYGLSVPVSGPAGLGWNYFRSIPGQSDALPPSTVGWASILAFVAYLLTLLVPFGVSNFIAGDVQGGFAKALFSFGPWGLLWIPFFFVASFFELYRAIFKTQDLFEKGASRPPPITLFMGDTGISKTIMKPEAYEKAMKVPSVNVYDVFIKPLLRFFGITDPKEVVEVALDTAKCSVMPPVKQTVEAGLIAADGIKDLAKTVPQIANEAQAKLQAFTDPVALQKAALQASGLPTLPVQSGGGGGSTVLDTLWVSGIGLLILGGVVAAVLRNFTATKKNGRNERNNDTPPNPGTV